MGTFSPHAGGGHTPCHECLSELSSSWTARKTCGSVSGEHIYDAAESFTVWTSAQNWDLFSSLTRVSWRILFQCGRWVSPDWRSFLLRNCEGTLVLRQIHAFLSPVLFLMQVAPEAYHFRLQNGLDKQKVYHLHLHPVLVCELDMLIFCSDRAKVTCLYGWADRSRDLGWYARLVSTLCPIVEYSAGEAYKPKAGHVHLCPLGSSSIIITKCLNWERENKRGTSPVSSTSTLVERRSVSESEWYNFQKKFLSQSRTYCNGKTLS